MWPTDCQRILLLAIIKSENESALETVFCLLMLYFYIAYGAIQTYRESLLCFDLGKLLNLIGKFITGIMVFFTKLPDLLFTVKLLLLQISTQLL